MTVGQRKSLKDYTNSNVDKFKSIKMLNLCFSKDTPNELKR